jgi:hypothetical protein
LVETESARWSDYVWDDGKGVYNIYRETIDFGAVESVAVWCQNLPPGKEVRCGISPLKAIPMQPGALRNPAFSINGITTVFPGEFTSGSWIECNGSDDCSLYGPKGEELRKIEVSGKLPMLRAGRNEIKFSCGSVEGPSPRVKVTVFTHGEVL